MQLKVHIHNSLAALSDSQLVSRYIQADDARRHTSTQAVGRVTFEWARLRAEMLRRGLVDAT